MLPVVDDKLLTRYLLGELSETEQAQVEEQLFADTACYDRLHALKAELTDQYVRGGLTAKEQQVFARRFLATKDGREDELFARALDVVLREESEAQQPVITTAATLSWREKLAQYFQSLPGLANGADGGDIVVDRGRGISICRNTTIAAATRRRTNQSPAGGPHRSRVIRTVAPRSFAQRGTRSAFARRATGTRSSTAGTRAAFRAFLIGVSARNHAFLNPCPRGRA